MPQLDPRTRWQQTGFPYYRQSLYYRERFGGRVQKVSLDAGFTCPNVDGTVTTGGCTFCDNRSFSPSRRTKRVSLDQQLENQITKVRQRYGRCRFLAYFQPATNTHAPVAKLRERFEIPLQHPDVVGIIVGTRPDCLPDDVLDYLQELASRTYVCLELGMQSMHDASLDWMNRGHHHDAFLDAMHRSKNRGFDIVAHVILGLPGETRPMMLQTAAELARTGVDGVKIHNLYAVNGTRLADQVNAGQVSLMDFVAYVNLVVDVLEHLPAGMVIERISGDAPKSYLVGPLWTLDKPALQRAVQAEFQRRGTCQGSRYDQS